MGVVGADATRSAQARPRPRRPPLRLGSDAGVAQQAAAAGRGPRACVSPAGVCRTAASGPAIPTGGSTHPRPPTGGSTHPRPDRRVAVCPLKLESRQSASAGSGASAASAAPPTRGPAPAFRPTRRRVCSPEARRRVATRIPHAPPRSSRSGAAPARCATLNCASAYAARCATRIAARRDSDGPAACGALVDSGLRRRGCEPGRLDAVHRRTAVWGGKTRGQDGGGGRAARRRSVCEGACDGAWCASNKTSQRRRRSVWGGVTASCVCWGGAGAQVPGG